MRYRALGRTGRTLSGVTLAIDDATPQAAREPLIYAALESGVNCFDIGGTDLAMFDDVGPALASVDRGLLFVSVRLGIGRDASGQIVRDFSPERLIRVIEAATARSGLQYLDLALLDDPAGPELPLTSLAALKAARDEERTRKLGVAGQGEAMDAYIASKAFDVLVTPYSLNSGWQDRHRLNAAAQADMSVLGYGYYPEGLYRRSAKSAGGGMLSRWLGGGGSKDAPIAGRGQDGYAFLDSVPGWTAEEICLAYALTEPGLASVLVYPRAPEAMEPLAAVTDRVLPPNLPAQIEMARFAAQPPAA
jgi:aryl-alcohol dehydrogenase-like predicted oxidoreductase